MEKHILICGERGVGKSTLIRRLLAESTLPVGGFVTRRLPQADGDGMFPIYLHAAALPPEERPYDPEHLVGTCDSRRSIRYPEAFDRLGPPLLTSGGLLVMDELGFLENDAHRFQAAVLAALVWLLVWYVEQRVLAKALGRVPEGADAQAVWEQHVLRKQGWTADSEQGRAALVRVRAGVAAMQEQPHEDVFTPATDGTRQHARLYRVPHAHATVILCHGYHSHAEHDFSAQFPALYASGGCNLLLIDERAHGLSEGKCLTFGQLERYDIAQWVHWVREHSRVQRPIALYGVSMGAASVLLAAQLPELKGELACVVADCGYSSFELEVTDAVRHGTRAPRWLQKPLARICVRILRRNGLDFDAVDTTPGMVALDLPILFFHGDADTFVPLHHSERNCAACGRPQRLVVIPGAEHAMSAQVEPERYRHELLTFLWRNTNYLWDERNKPLK